jgi:hypothetical protein
VQKVLLVQDEHVEGQTTLQEPAERVYPAWHPVQVVSEVHVVHNEGQGKQVLGLIEK